MPWTTSTAFHPLRWPPPADTSCTSPSKSQIRRDSCLSPELLGDGTAHGEHALPIIPHRSRRIAARSMSYILASKLGEHHVLKRLGLTNGCHLRPHRPSRRTTESTAVTPTTCKRFASCFHRAAMCVPAAAAAWLLGLGLLTDATFRMSNVTP